MVKMIPALIQGGSHSDARGKLTFNNDFDASEIKRFYTIENKDPQFVRGWQGHKIEQRWFSAITGSFKIQIISVDYFENENKDLTSFQFELNAENMDILHVPSGYMSSIQSLDPHARLLVMADYMAGEINDELRFPIV